jgi:spore germination cell wall hydrolase CwlJ-like protein
MFETPYGYSYDKAKAAEMWAELEMSTGTDEVAPLTDEERDALARTVYGEGNNQPLAEKMKIVQVVFNRLDDGRFGDSITAVITAPNQFHGYDADNPLTDDNLDAVDAAQTVRKSGLALGDWLYFSGNKNGTANVFR